MGIYQFASLPFYSYSAEYLEDNSYSNLLLMCFIYSTSFVAVCAKLDAKDAQCTLAP